MICDPAITHTHMLDFLAVHAHMHIFIRTYILSLVHTFAHLHPLSPSLPPFSPPSSTYLPTYVHFPHTDLCGVLRTRPMDRQRHRQVSKSLLSQSNTVQPCPVQSSPVYYVVTNLCEVAYCFPPFLQLSIPCNSLLTSLKFN